MKLTLILLLFVAAWLAACESPAAPSEAPAQEWSAAFSALVDEFLDECSRRHPSIAAGNGLHKFDDRLESFSAEAIRAEVALWRAMRNDMSSIPTARLSADEQVDHRILLGLLDAWILDLDTNKNWQKNLMIYAAAISDGVHNLMTMESAPAEERAKRIVSKLDGVQALLAFARDNLSHPPRVMSERGVRMLKGASAMLTGDLAVAFADLRDETLKSQLADA